MYLYAIFLQSNLKKILLFLVFFFLLFLFSFFVVVVVWFLLFLFTHSLIQKIILLYSFLLVVRFIDSGWTGWVLKRATGCWRCWCPVAWDAYESVQSVTHSQRIISFRECECECVRVYGILESLIDKDFWTLCTSPLRTSTVAILPVPMSTGSAQSITIINFFFHFFFF